MSAVRVLPSDPDLLAAVEDPARRHTAREELVASEITLEAGEKLDVRSLAQSRGLGVTEGARSAVLEELHARLAEQRELLCRASERHRRQLSRLRDRSDRLRATTRLSALGRLAGGVDEDDGWPDDTDGVAEPERQEERAG